MCRCTSTPCRVRHRTDDVGLVVQVVQLNVVSTYAIRRALLADHREAIIPT